MMEAAWFQEESKKYLNQNVRYMNERYVVKELFWDDRDERIVFFIETTEGKLLKVFEEQIELEAFISKQNDQSLLLVEIIIERQNETQISHRLLNSQEELQEIKQELEQTQKRLYSDSYFVGRYAFTVTELDVNQVFVSDLKLTLKEFKKLMDAVEA